MYITKQFNAFVGCVTHLFYSVLHSVFNLGAIKTMKLDIHFLNHWILIGVTGKGQLLICMMYNQMRMEAGRKSS